ncbi:hypothetical protein jhhlp_000060 [Lomentospora prolificans]|uniref:Cullin family profile domain-containing protein n=1 Tax=Lomentospora prolificans TaxID=41688 RepID=A0A2N3NLJ6_9PEZI|nr:hypothetical protein jhhlp_000060 [Lomentospora prolificans]
MDFPAFLHAPAAEVIGDILLPPTTTNRKARLSLAGDVEPFPMPSSNAAKPTSTASDLATSGSAQPTPQDSKRRRTIGSESRPPSSAPAMKRPKMSDAPTQLQRPIPMGTGKEPMSGLGPKTMRTTVKKLVIKNRRIDGSDQQAEIEKYFESIWSEISDALGDILRNKRPKVPFDRMFRDVEDLCRNKKEQEVYKKLITTCELYLAEVVLATIKSSRKRSDTEVLASVLSEWKSWNEKSKIIRSTFAYLDASYLARQKELPQINDALISRFRKVLSSGPGAKLTDGRSVAQVVADGMCELIHFDRVSDDRFKPSLLRDAVSMLHIFGVYTRWFEPRLLEVSAAYFTEFASERSMTSLRDYIRQCRTLLDDETHRCDAYNLDSSSKQQMLGLLHKHLIHDHLQKLLDLTSISRLIEGGEIESVGALYQLLKLSGVHEKLKEPWGKYIRDTGSGIVQDTERGDEMVTRLLSLRRSLDLILREALEKDDGFLWTLREAFNDFMNDRKNAQAWESGQAKIGELIAKHIDLLLRGGLKALPRALYTNNTDRLEAESRGKSTAADEDGELEHQVDQAIALFRFVEGKDAFEAFYKRDLARRLLMDKSASQDAERMTLSKLRGECGANFTHNLEQMFKDKALAKDEMETYRQACQASEYKLPFDLQVMVLSSAAWPSYNDLKVNMPHDIANQIERFDTYYKRKHNGRVLTWKHGLGHCTITARFKRGEKELNVSFLQAVVLLTFNDVEDAEALTYQQISQMTNLSGGDLDRTLQSLACGKTRVLTKHPKGRDINQSDTFTFNRGFWDDRYRIKINQIQMKETKAENKATHERIVQDRRLETQAAIVRIMKSRKTMTHALLVAEVIDMTKSRGPVDAAQIKKEIESLIEKDYMEREGTSYKYLA